MLYTNVITFPKGFAELDRRTQQVFNANHTLALFGWIGQAEQKGLQHLTSRDLFHEALEKVKSLQGTSEAKADLFEAEADRLKQLTKGSWSAHRLISINGDHVFLGSAGHLLVIDPSGSLFTGQYQNAVLQFIPPKTVELDYSKLNPKN